MSEMETRPCEAGELAMSKEGWAFCDAQDEKRAGPKPDQRCMTCRHATEPFEVLDAQNVHCEHPDWHIASWPPGWAKSKADVGGWDTLRDEWDTCEHWAIKQPSQPGAIRAKGETMKEQYNGLHVGDTVNCNGYAMRVTELLEWDESRLMIEATNGRGGVCIDSSVVHKIAAATPVGTKLI